MRARLLTVAIGATLAAAPAALAAARRVARRLSPGDHRVELVVTDADGLRSDKRTRPFPVR